MENFTIKFFSIITLILFVLSINAIANLKAEIMDEGWSVDCNYDSSGTVIYYACWKPGTYQCNCPSMGSDEIEFN